MEPSKFYVDGQWRTSDTRRPVVNPFTGKPVVEVYQASPGDIEAAISSAVQSFPSTRDLPTYKRAEILSFISREISASKEQIAQMVTLETGKPISFSRGEVDRSIFTFQVSSEEAARIEGDILPLDLGPQVENRFALVRRFPLGPISAITPFNFPINLIAHKVGPAIAAGNTVVLKPSSNAPNTALMLAAIINRSGLPKGAFNVVPCFAGEADQLITDKRIRLISFTGSPPVGWGIKDRAGRKRVLLELGGNAAVIVDRDANLEYALQRILLGGFGNAGQSCIAVQRIYVHDAVYDEFADRFLRLTTSLAVGDPTKERTMVGPMIDEQAARKAESWINEAVKGGAAVLCGGKRTGAVLEPTVMVNVQPSMKVSCQEVFAPLVTLDRFTEFEDAVSQANNSAFGLQAGVFTNNLKHMLYAYKELEVGGVIINDSSSFRMDHMPYGGVKESGFGREGIRYAVEEMTEMKLLAIHNP